MTTDNAPNHKVIKKIFLSGLVCGASGLVLGRWPDQWGGYLIVGGIFLIAVSIILAWEWFAKDWTF